MAGDLGAVLRVLDSIQLRWVSISALSLIIGISYAFIKTKLTH